ncbi:hypothetical protein ACI3L1_02530 [Deinococcus sp. SM5_A1]|uniref:hypothetical protein n=1 Tax=Deinococcus sp. SM5_A1 TaxID=3379094 RepID=UPI00385C65FC
MFNQNNLKRPAATFAAAVGLSLVLSACGGGGGSTPEPDPTPAPQPVPNGQITMIQGQITPFSAGVANSVDKRELAIPAPVDSVGKFDLALPSTSVMTGANSNLLFSVNNPDASVFGLCKDITTDAPDDLRVYPINFLRTDKDDQIISPLMSNKASATRLRAWWFSNKDITFKYKGDCLGLGKIDTTITLKSGWSILDTEIDPGVSTTYAATTAPLSYVPWVKTTAAVGAQSLAPNILEPWKNLPTYRNR